jgi:hypothetical protein
MNKDELEEALSNKSNSSIMKLNSIKISKIKDKIINELELNKKESDEIKKKLKMYRYVDEMNDLEIGNYIRWISIKQDVEEIKLTNGGHIISIEVFQDGIHIRCKNNFNNIFQIRLDENLVFQKLTPQEILILQVIDYLEV